MCRHSGVIGTDSALDLAVKRCSRMRGRGRQRSPERPLWQRSGNHGNAFTQLVLLPANSLLWST